MEDGDKVDVALNKEKKSYAGIPEADFVVSTLSGEKVGAIC